MTLRQVARVTDRHVCPIHGSNSIVTGEKNILVNNLPIARVNDSTGCGATIVKGANYVYGANYKVAYLGSTTSHGGTITTGSFDTFVDDGSSGSGGGGAGASGGSLGSGFGFNDGLSILQLFTSGKGALKGAVVGEAILKNTNAFVQKAPVKINFSRLLSQDCKDACWPLQQISIEDQQKMIQEAHEISKKMVDSAIEALEKAKLKESKRVKYFFGIKGKTEEDKAKLDEVIANYKKMKSGVDYVGYTTLNNYDGKLKLPDNMLAGGTPAYVAGAAQRINGQLKFIPTKKNNVNIIFPTFGRVIYDDHERAMTIVHEISHLKVGTIDYAYAINNDLLGDLPQHKKMLNSGSYGAYAALSLTKPSP